MLDTALKLKTTDDLRKSLAHLNYSFGKVQKMDLGTSDWTEEELEVLESFSSRFARSSDHFVSRYLRLIALESDPAFRGTLIDLLNFAEKQGLIESAKDWYRIRELRNVAAHEYSTDQFNELIRELIRLTPFVLAVGAHL